MLGGGPAGASCAIRLRSIGVDVDLAEATAFPREKVCGCCIGGAGLAALETIGMATTVRQRGVALDRWVGSLGDRRAEVSLPVGVAISRSSLDRELLSEAARRGAVVHQPCRGVVTEVEADGVTVRLSRDDQVMQVRYGCVVIAAGLGGGAITQHLPWIEQPHGPFGISFSCLVDPACRPGTIYMACDDDGYVGAVELQNGRVDIAAALRSGAEAAKRGTPRERVRQILSDSQLPPWRLNDVSPVLTTSPLRRRREAGRGRLIAIGDSAGYVEPFTGEGMTWAIQSGIAAADLIGQSDRWLTIGEQWRTTYASLFRRRKWVCRVVTSALRSRSARQFTGRLLANWPTLAKPLVRGLNSRQRRFARSSEESGKQ